MLIFQAHTDKLEYDWSVVAYILTNEMSNFLHAVNCYVRICSAYFFQGVLISEYNLVITKSVEKKQDIFIHQSQVIQENLLLRDLFNWFNPGIEPRTLILKD